MGAKGLFRRKQVDSDRHRAGGHHQLAKALSIPQLIAIGSFSSEVLVSFLFLSPLVALVVRNCATF